MQELIKWLDCEIQLYKDMRMKYRANRRKWGARYV